MNKKQTKLSLIEDYIKIGIMKNFYSNDFSIFDLSTTQKEDISFLKNTASSLNILYEALLKQCKMTDASFLVLQNELSNNNVLFKHNLTNNQIGIDQIINNHKSQIEKIKTELCSKLNKLKICLNL